MAIVEQLRQQLLGDGLLTVNRVEWPADAASAEVIDLQRVWSSRPEHYPVSGRKRKTLTDWTRQLLLRGEVFAGEGEDALAQAFDDNRLILSMGLRAVVNVPLLDSTGRCAATFNLLGTRETWTGQERVQIELLAAVARPWILAAPR
ncbi:GAF domain-containing protein [Xylophilus rhododendri]|uniref:GAF domain-containing protein n=2 Tax=Xylophilus rhododendri TaxID=2697032 RepID=A0A857JER0_9BURK|nr:GAF domain-containing protein [Xylophilus rhododendri]